MSKFLVSLLAVMSAFAFTMSTMVPTVSAGDDACDGDPPIMVRTPGGNPVLVNNFLNLPPRLRAHMREIDVSGRSERIDAKHSKIIVTLMVPTNRGHGLSIKVRSLVQKFNVSAEAEGTTGSPITVELIVPLP